MIKASALLVVLAIGLLVAGVVGSSLLMVYVSIGVCAVAALLLAVGVLSHWSEIFGRRGARPASTQGAWSEPQVHVTAPVLASIQAQAVAAARESGRSGRDEAGVRPDGARPGAARPGGPRPGDARPGGGRVPERPAEVVPSPAEVTGRGDEIPAPGRNDDLWERVEEELGSAAKRDTGALSWPGTVFPPVPPDEPVPAESAAQAPEAGPRGEPRVGASAWIWGSGAKRQPSETADPAWPPPAAAFAEPQAAPKPAAPEPDASGSATPEPAATEPVVPEPAATEPVVPEAVVPEPAAAGSGGPGDTDGPPVSGEMDAEPASGAEVAQDTEVAEGTEAVPDDKAAQDADVAEDAKAVSADDATPDDGVVPDAEASSAAEDQEAAGLALESTSGKPADGDDGPDWIIATSRPAGQEHAAGTPAAQSPAAQEATVEEATVEEAAGEEPVAGDSAAKEPAAQAAAVADPTGGESADPAGGDSADPAGGDSAAPDPAAKEPAAKEPAAKEPAAKAPGPDAPGAPESAAEEPASDGATAKPAPGRVEVTVVPGVARYHRSGCILIRFLGAGDLEIMTRQEAEDAKFAACRACQPDQLED